MAQTYRLYEIHPYMASPIEEEKEKKRQERERNRDRDRDRDRERQRDRDSERMSCHIQSVTSKDTIGWNVLSSPWSGRFFECPKPKFQQIQQPTHTLGPTHTHASILSRSYQTGGKTMSHTNVCALSESLRTASRPEPIITNKNWSCQTKTREKITVFLFFCLPLSSPFSFSMENDADNRYITAIGFNIEVIFINIVISDSSLTGRPWHYTLPDERLTNLTTSLPPFGSAIYWLVLQIWSNYFIRNSHVT